MINKPTIILEKDNNVLLQDPFSILYSKRIIYLFGEINDDLMQNINAQLIYLDNLNNDEINIYLCSPGGCVSSALAIYDTIRFLKSNVRIICIGLVASAAVIVLCAASKGNRYALANADIMIHEIYTNISGNASDISTHSKRVKKLYDRVNNILAISSGNEISKIEEDCRYDFYLDAKEAIEYGFIDEIINDK